MNLGRGGKPERVRGAVVSANYFNVLGVQPLVGRTFLPEEDRTPNANPVAVIGHGLWQRRFGADPRVIGQTITVNEHEFTIIGVTPKDFGSPFSGAAIDVWTPVMMKDYVARPHFSDGCSQRCLADRDYRPGPFTAVASASIRERRRGGGRRQAAGAGAQLTGKDPGE